MMRSLALAACLALPLSGAALAQSGGPVNPGSGPSAGGTVNENTPAQAAPRTGTTGTTGMQPGMAPGATTGTVAPGARGNGAGPSAGGTVNKDTPASR